MIYHNPKVKDENRKRFSLIDEMVEVRKISYEKDDSGNIRVDSLGNLNVTDKQKYRKTALILPIGAGIKINGKGSFAPLSVGLELNYRYVFSDFLDGVGNKVYHDYSVTNPRKNNDATYLNDWNSQRSNWEKLAGPHNNLDYQELVNNGYKRGNPGNDSFMTTVFRVTYTFYRWRDPLWKK